MANGTILIEIEVFHDFYTDDFLNFSKENEKKLRIDSTPRRESGGAGQVSGCVDPRKGRLTVPMGSLWRRHCCQKSQNLVLVLLPHCCSVLTLLTAVPQLSVVLSSVASLRGPTLFARSHSQAVSGSGFESRWLSLTAVTLQSLAFNSL